VASAAAGEGPVVAVVGHPYNLLDPEISGGALTRLRSYGAGLLLPTGLPSPVSKQAAARLDHAAKMLYWSSGREILGAALAVLENWWADGLLFLTSFKCGVDALLVEVLARLVKELPRERPPFCILTLDEQGGGEVLATRLEALCDVALAARRRRPAATPLG
jgi:predicted nucleotide-binding protein (sugar kinase/HSP70/actin superfamily)